MIPAIFLDPNDWFDRAQPWVRLVSFFITVLVAGRQRWSARDLVWSFWLAGFLLGTIYILVNQVADSLSAPRRGEQTGLSHIVGALGSFAGTFFIFLFAYLIFAIFLDGIFTMIALDMEGEPMPPFLASIPSSISHALTNRWSFLLISGVSLLPVYIMDAITVDFTDFSKPIFARDLLRMIILIFILVPLTLLGLGIFALYAILFVYFLPLDSLRRIAGQMWRFATSQSSRM